MEQLVPLRVSQDTSVRDIILYNPHDIERDLKGKGFSKKDFKHFFYLIPEFIRYRDEVIKNITQGDFHKNIVILYGYSGCGKTTFLHWLQDQLPENYHFNITNLNDLPIAESDTNTFKKVISLKVKEILANPNGKSLIASNEQLIREITTDTGFVEKVNDIYLSHSNKSEVDSKINSLISSIEFKNLLFLFIVESLSRLNLSEHKSITFCFDNLDEVKFEYLTESFWDDFKEVRRNLIQFFNKKPNEIEFDFQNCFTFILTFREANLIVRSSQYMDRLGPSFEKKKLILSESARKIISKRLKILNEYFKFSLKNSPISYFIKIISLHDYADKFYLPLFNYDYRKLLQAIVEVGTSQGIERSLPISKYRYDTIAQKSMRIARGTMIHRIIKHLFSKNEIIDFATLPDSPNMLPDKGFCRKSRILLTIIYRFSYPDGVPKDQYHLKSINPKKRTLSDVFNSFSELFPLDTEIFDLLEEFFNIHKSSWAHLISIYNKSGDKVKINFVEEKQILEQIRNNEQSVDYLINRLNKYQVHINSSGYIYLRNVLIHFEYFTNLINERNTSNYKSLIESIEFDNTSQKFEFQIIIEKVLKKLNKYKTNIDNFIKYEIIENGMSLRWYLEEEYVFKQDPSSTQTLYFTRIVSSHIDYIDKFRVLIFQDNVLRKKIKSSGKTKAFINKYLVDKQSEYISLLETGYQDHVSPKVISVTKDRIRQVRRKGYDHWHPVTKEGLTTHNSKSWPTAG